MKLYRVYGTTTVCVAKEVWANSPDEAIERADDELNYLTAYCGNGGYDKLIGVEGDNESVDSNECIDWDDAEEIEDDPDYRECPRCHKELDEFVGDNGEKYWECYKCGTFYNEEYEKVDPEDYCNDEDE